MSDVSRASEVSRPKTVATKGVMSRARRALVGMTMSLLVGIWFGGGTDRYGEEEGVLGGLRGAQGTFKRTCHYTVATLKGCLTSDWSFVRKLGLERQIENRLWQDKRLVAEAIVVEVEEGGKIILMGQVTCPADKEKAVTLARDTRGVETVVDQLAVATASRTIDASSSPAVPTGVASGVRVMR